MESAEHESISDHDLTIAVWLLHLFSAVWIAIDNSAIRQWSGLQEHRKRLADLRNTLRQEAARDIRVCLRREIRQELRAKTRMVKGEQRRADIWLAILMGKTSTLNEASGWPFFEQTRLGCSCM